MRALLLAARAIAVTAVVTLSLAAVACTSGTTPDCSDGGCGPLPTEGGEEAGPPDAPPADAPVADAHHTD